MRSLNEEHRPPGENNQKLPPALSSEPEGRRQWEGEYIRPSKKKIDARVLAWVKGKEPAG